MGLSDPVTDLVKLITLVSATLCIVSNTWKLIKSTEDSEEKKKN